ncbi:MAG: hypothetical protein ABI912_10890 [Actinomycetota bacterium]
MSTRRLLIPAVTAVAVVLIAAGAGVVAHRHGDKAPAASPAKKHPGSPILPALATDTGRDMAAAGTAQLGAPEQAGKIAAPAPGTGTPSVIVRGLPTATDALVPAYRLERRKPTADDVTRLGAALGLKGTAQANGSGWVLSDGTRYLAVDPTPGIDWRLGPGDLSCGTGGGTGSSTGSGGTPQLGAPAGTVATAVPPDQPVEPNAKPAAPTAAVKPSAIGAEKPPATRAPDAGKSADDMPKDLPSAAPGGPAGSPITGSCGGGVASSGVACAAPEGAETFVACPTQPAKPVAGENAARAAALALMDKLGVKAEAADVRVDAGYDGVRHVSVGRRVEGRPVDGMNYELGVDVSGAVVTANGLLAVPVLAGEYPMLPPAELAQTLGNTRVRMMLCRQVKGTDGCAPPPPIVVTGASVGLSLAMPADYDTGEAYLLPAWLFTIEGDPQPTAVVAVPSKYRSEPEPTGLGKGSIEPAPLPPTGVSPTAPDAVPGTGSNPSGRLYSDGGEPQDLSSLPAKKVGADAPHG